MRVCVCESRGYNMEWLVEDFEEAIKSELDCENEASNLEYRTPFFPHNPPSLSGRSPEPSSSRGLLGADA